MDKIYVNMNLKNSYLSCISEDYDEGNKSNLDVNYNLLSNAINEVSDIYEANQDIILEWL